MIQQLKNMFIIGILPGLFFSFLKKLGSCSCQYFYTYYNFFYFLKNILKYYIGIYVIIVSEKVWHLKHKWEIQEIVDIYIAMTFMLQVIKGKIVSILKKLSKIAIVLGL